MEVKKTPKADLENKRIIFLEIGFIFALLLVFLAFEWRVETAHQSGFQTIQEEIAEEEIIPVTRQIVKPPPPPPAPKVSDILEIVDDETILDEELEIEDAETEDINKGTTQTLDQYGDGEEVAEEYGDDLPFLVVEKMPKFKGNMFKWLGSQIHYPENAKNNGVMGRVIVQFVIEKNGAVSNVQVLRKIDPDLDAEAVRVISKMPKWSPGKQRGKPVRVSLRMPIDFNLN